MLLIVAVMWLIHLEAPMIAHKGLHVLFGPSFQELTPEQAATAMATATGSISLLISLLALLLLLLLFCL